MRWENIVPVALICALFGLVILVMLWPGEKHGRKVLHRWGVTDPSEAEVDVAVRYLKRRRFWYPWLYVALGPLAELTDLWPNDNSIWTIPVSVLIGTMLAELLALRPAGGPRRSASLMTRRLVDLVPVWSLVAVLAMTLVALAVGLSTVVGLGILADPDWTSFRQSPFQPRPWVVIGTAAVSAALVALVLFAALRRPANEPERTDIALRTRSARVAIGLQVAVVGGTLAGQYGGVYVVAFAIGIVCWTFVVTPLRQRAPSAA